MDNIETFHNQKTVAAETVDFRFRADLFKSAPMILALAIMDNIETLYNKKMVAEETVGFSFDADLFKSVKMILGFGCHRKHRDV